MSSIPTRDPAAFPTHQAGFILTGPAGALEILSNVATRPQARAGTAVICHPHPLHGGTMHNKVVTMLERSLRESGLDTLRFNFRGVGQSEGCFDNGLGESDDLVSVVTWLRRVRPSDALWLAGFSFGSYVTLCQAATLQVSALISVAPPVGHWKIDPHVRPTCPWLVVMGENDTVVEPRLVFDWIKTMAHPPELVRIPGTGHFFHRHLIDLRDAVKHAIRLWLPAPRA